MNIFSSFSEIQKLKIHIFKMFWDTIRCTEKHKDLSEGSREDMGDMEKYRDIMNGVRNIMGNKERDRQVEGHHQVGVPGVVHGPHGGVTEHPNCALEPLVMSKYLTGHPNLTKDDAPLHVCPSHN
jgi:hypothetical protein